MRQSALVQIAPYSAATDSSQAASWIEQAAKHVDDMNASVAKLRIMVALANAYFVRGDEVRALAMTDHALDLGEELYAQFMIANPGALSYSADGFDELMDLVRNSLGRVKKPETMIARIGEVRQDVLKATLLTVAAEAWSQRQSKSA